MKNNTLLKSLTLLFLCLSASHATPPTHTQSEGHLGDKLHQAEEARRAHAHQNIARPPHVRITGATPRPSPLAASMEFQDPNELSSFSTSGDERNTPFFDAADETPVGHHHAHLNLEPQRHMSPLGRLNEDLLFLYASKAPPQTHLRILRASIKIYNEEVAAQTKATEAAAAKVEAAIEAALSGAGIAGAGAAGAAGNQVPLDDEAIRQIDEQLVSVFKDIPGYDDDILRCQIGCCRLTKNLSNSAGIFATSLGMGVNGLSIIVHQLNPEDATTPAALVIVGTTIMGTSNALALIEKNSKKAIAARKLELRQLLMNHGLNVAPDIDLESVMPGDGASQYGGITRSRSDMSDYVGRHPGSQPFSRQTSLATSEEEQQEEETNAEAFMGSESAGFWPEQQKEQQGWVSYILDTLTYPAEFTAEWLTQLPPLTQDDKDDFINAHKARQEARAHDLYSVLQEAAAGR